MQRFLLAAALALAAGACVTEDDLGTDDLALSGDDTDWAYEAPALTAIEQLDAEPCATMLRVAPTVDDARSRNGVSCMTCHWGGLVPREDEIREAPSRGGARRP